MTPVVNDIIRIVVVMSRGADLDVYTNTFHFKVTTAGWASNQEFMTEMALYLDGSYTLVASQISNLVSFDHIDGQNLTQKVLLPLTTFPFLTGGTNTSDMLPPQTTARPYFPTTRPLTRAAIGLPPFGESSTAGVGALDASAIGQAEDFADDLLGTLTVLNGAFIYGAYNHPLVRFTPVDSRVVPARLRTLRRRRAGVGS